MSDQEKKLPAKAAPKKPNIFVRVGKLLGAWIREMRSELRKVVWPTPKQVINNSTIVVIAVIAVGAVIALFDLGATRAVMALISVFNAVV